ncbi:hypothetical protein [Bradyrhizobium sp. OK095]|uniref:NACHT domain-containing protein n=1 Tax=Bradyrhizobium sp. OK095 TaxID=1882760 RepID=UPI0008BF47D2|nr:hypothetical protein [Bradyrhizobium sp. OK095]SEO22782.1 hypothetical protein SAMN05443254_12265 [Bradyrhizobium sp. OK095]
MTVRTKFVTVLGNRSTRDAGQALLTALAEERLLISTNIDGLYPHRIFSTDGDVLQNIRNSSAIGLIILISDAFFRYLDTEARAEKEVILDYINKGGRVLAILGEDPITDRPEFNFNRLHFRLDAQAAFQQQVRTWVRSGLSTDDDNAEEYHPDLIDILRAAFSKTVEEIPRSPLEMRAEMRVNYALYKYIDTFLGSVNYILYLPAKIVISRTAEMFLKSHSGLTKDQTLLVLVDPKYVTNRDTWLRTIKQNLPAATNHMYLDDFLQSRFSLSFVHSSQASVPRIIASRMRREADGALITDTFDYISQKLVEEDSQNSVLLIKGAGGVGKSTLFSYMSAALQTAGKHDLIVFDATRIATELSETPELRGTFTLFNLIRSIYSGHDVGALSEKEFAWVFDTGRISIVIDGIDEIISRIPTLDSLRMFFDSVNKYSNYMRKGKIILTCRSMDSLGSIPEEFGFDAYDLLPFAPEQIDEYLDLRFGDVERLKRDAREFIADLKLTYEDGILPFVIRIICDSIQDGRESTTSDKLYQSSEYLDVTRKLDYIVYKVCDREEAKYGYGKYLASLSSVDFQAKLFLELAVQGRGRFDRTDVIRYFKRFNTNYDDKVIEQFYHHPLLHTPHIVEFTDVAVFELFLAVAVCRYLADKESISASEATLMADRGQINSPFVKDVASRVSELSDAVVYQMHQLIAGSEDAFLYEDQNEQYYRNASLIMNIGLQILMRGANDQLMARSTNLLVDLFSVRAAPLLLKHVALHNIPSASGARFDFSEMHVEGASIIDFADFPRCKFSAEKTRFINSRIRTGLARTLSTNAAEAIFVGCDLDHVFLQSMARRVERESNQIEDAKQHARSFLGKFRLNNSFFHRRQMATMQANFVGKTKLSFSTTVKIGASIGLIEQEGQDLWIQKRFISDVETFVLERHNRGIIDKFIEGIIEKLK